jgi:hypothetical protein
VTLEVTDGDNSVNATVVFEVRKKDEDGRRVPGFGTVIFMAGLVVALIVKTNRELRRRRRWSR